MSVVTCKCCPFERAVGTDDDVRPNEVLLHHGRQTGHELRLERGG